MARGWVCVSNLAETSCGRVCWRGWVGWFGWCEGGRWLALALSNRQSGHRSSKASSHTHSHWTPLSLPYTHQDKQTKDQNKVTSKPDEIASRIAFFAFCEGLPQCAILRAPKHIQTKRIFAIRSLERSWARCGEWWALWWRRGQASSAYKCEAKKGQSNHLLLLCLLASVPPTRGKPPNPQQTTAIRPTHQTCLATHPLHPFVGSRRSEGVARPLLPTSIFPEGHQIRPANAPSKPRSPRT